LEALRDSEDIREALSLANRLATKTKRTTPADRDYLSALIFTHRKFNRLDGLLSRLHIPLRRLKMILEGQAEDPASPPSRFLEEATQWAKQDRHRRGVIDVEHWLKAFCDSDDSLVRYVVQEYRLSPARIEQAVEGLHNTRFQRTLLFMGRELAEVVIFVLTFLILIKSCLGELRLIPSESMVPGLQIDDRLVIERLTHWTRPYQRGDILVFYPPMTRLGTDPWSIFMRITGFSSFLYKKEDNVDVAYIKRLIGQPGDIVDVHPGEGVFVNGKKLDEPYVNEIANTCTLMQPETYCGPVRVPPHMYYMMGDNRNLSLDSRYWGFAREDRIIGRAVFRIWPVNRMGFLPMPPETATTGSAKE
jgi:signal peptidase I